jgi:hypothetical protein
MVILGIIIFLWFGLLSFFALLTVRAFDIASKEAKRDREKVQDLRDQMGVVDAFIGKHDRHEKHFLPTRMKQLSDLAARGEIDKNEASILIGEMRHAHRSQT